MKVLTGIVIALTVLAAAAQTPPQEPRFGFGPVVKLEGTVTRVNALRGQGAPFLEVEKDGDTTKIILGSMRYLMSHDFNPKAGEPIRIEGFQTSDGEMVAKTVVLPSQDKELEFRDADGRPLWQQGRYGHRRGAGNRKQQGTNQ